MIGTVFYWASLAVLVWVMWHLDRWKWSACTCHRERMPWFYRSHMKEWLMVAQTALMALCAVVNALTQDMGWAIIFGLFFVWELKVIVEHRKGKRSILGRLAGRVRINDHGRLVIADS